MGGRPITRFEVYNGATHAISLFGWVGGLPMKYTADTAYSEFYVVGSRIIFKRQRSSLFGIMDTFGTTLAPPKFEDVQFYPQGYFVYKMPGDTLFGLMDASCKILVKPIYEHVEVVHDSVRVTKNGDNDHPDKYYRFLDSRHFKPTSGWMHDTAAERNYKDRIECWKQIADELERQKSGNWCGFAASRNRAAAQAEHERARTHPYIVKDSVLNSKSF